MMTGPRPLFQTILAATATPSTVDGAVITAARLARRHGACLKIVHVVPMLKAMRPGVPSPADPAPETMGVDKNSARGMTQELIALYEQEYPELTGDDIQIVPGVAWEAVFRASVDPGCDLIVVGPHTRPANVTHLPAASRFLGSTADGVLRQARCPVLIANRAFEGDLLDFANITVGIDFSASCASAICLAALIARRYGSLISTFHMLPIPPYPKYTPQAFQADSMRIQKRLNRICSLLLEDIGHQFFLKPGARPHLELLQFARQFGADLIIMGSHTKDKSGKWYTGSVVQQVAFHAQCPVIVVNGLRALDPWKSVDWPMGRFVQSFCETDIFSI